MPFPLAHPAAVLPLERYCPRYLSFPALLIGSLSPDVGYLFGPLEIAHFSHGFLGSFGFCLPVSLVLVYGARALALRDWSERVRWFSVLFRTSVWGSPLTIGVSALIGAWTHIFLDSLYHEDSWLVQHMGFLRTSAGFGAASPLHVYDLVYCGLTFGGVASVAWRYLRWRETSCNQAGKGTPVKRVGYSTVFAAGVLFFSLAAHGGGWLGIAALAMITAVLVWGFVALTNRYYLK